MVEITDVEVHSPLYRTFTLDKEVECRAGHDVVKLLNEKLGDGGRRDGVAELVSKAVADSMEVLVNGEVLKLYSANPEFAKFLTEYLEGKPRWLT